MGRALIHSVKHGLGDKFTDDMKDAWVSGLCFTPRNNVIATMNMRKNMFCLSFPPSHFVLDQYPCKFVLSLVVINSLQVEVYGALSYDMIRAQKMGKR
jgi:hypothetical protein